MLWCAYAWPLEAGETGRRVFFINQSGDVLSTHNVEATCSGKQKMPKPDAAYHADSDGRMNAKTGANAAGRDGARRGPESACPLRGQASLRTRARGTPRR